MTHPRDIDAPDGIDVDEFGDRERNGEMFEYVRFVADMTVVERSAVESFTTELRNKCDDWEIGQGGGKSAEEQYIEMRKVYHRAEDEPPIPDEVLEEQREKEAEYYNNR